MKKIVDVAYQRTLDLLTEHKEAVAKVAEYLLANETINQKEIVDLIGPRPFPMPLARLMVALYRAPRAFIVNGVVCLAIAPNRGVAQGCTFACTAIQIYTLPIIRRYREKFSEVPLNLYIDDSHQQVEGPEDRVVKLLAEAALGWRQMIESDLRCTISQPKAAVVSSSTKAAKRLQAALHLRKSSDHNIHWRMTGNPAGAGPHTR